MKVFKKIYSWRLCCLILILLVNHTAFSQLGEPQPKFRNFTVEDGLPGSETYFVHQDRKGYIWICTDRGVSRFDGHIFQNYTMADGLVDNVVFKIYEDYKGRIWFISYNSKLCYFENDKIHPYKYNDLIIKCEKMVKLAPQKNIYVDKNDKLYISINVNGIFTIDKVGNFKRIHEEKHVVIKKYDAQMMWYYYYNEADFKDKIDTAKIYVYYHSNSGKRKITSLPWGGRISLAQSGDQEYLLAENELFSLNTGKILLQEKGAISLRVNKKDFWIGTFKNGVVHIPEIQHPGQKFRYLNNLSVTSVLCDSEGGYWFSTLEKGIFYTPSLSVKNYTVEQGLIDDDVLSISGIRNDIYMGFLMGRWQNISNPAYSNTVKSDVFHVVVVGNSGSQFYISTGYTFRFKNGKRKECIYPGWTADFYPTGNGVIYGKKDLFRTDDDGMNYTIYNFWKDDLAHRKNGFHSLMQDHNNQVWIGTLTGLYYVENGSMQSKGLDDPVFKARISDLASHPKWKNIAATRGEGIYFFDKKQITRKLKTKDGLLSDLVNCLFIDASGGIWAGTNKGLNYITKDQNGHLKIESFTTLNGLISNEISGIYVYNGIVYAGTKRGLAVIDTKSYVRNSNFPGIYIKFMETANEKLDLTKHHVFGYQEPYIKIGFRNSNYKTQGKTTYRYRFNKQSKWITTDNPEITLISPLSGEYNLEISYLNEDGIWSPPKSICQFTIDEAFYNKWYFFVGMTILLGLIAWRIFRFRIRQLKQRHVLNDKISQLEQKALQAQMNPHFIFNALNSIQSFLVYEENDKAEKYLLKFAKLIRQTLNNSREQYITLESEISTLEKYLDLERMRFKNKFSYHIQNDLVEREMSLKIPNMLIQPFVENAVIHGFSTLESGGEILIRLESVDGNQILCTVEDNGVGRQKTMQQSASKHISHGITITEERLRAFETKHGVSFKIETIDLENADGSKGTRVVINLPVIPANPV